MTEIDKVREQIAREIHRQSHIRGGELHGNWEDVYQESYLEDANQILSLPIQVEPERECPECDEGTVHIKLHNVFGINTIDTCPACHFTGRLPAVTKTIGEIIRGAIK